jgi:hypothetical protein
MPRVYELPTHLQVEDQLIAGLTARQLLRIVVGASLAYLARDQLSELPDEIRWSLAGLLAITGVLFALVQPSGRPLDQWVLAGLIFVVLPRRLGWQHHVELPGQSPGDHAGWAELDLRPEWPGVEVPSNVEQESRSGMRALWRLRPGEREP